MASLTSGEMKHADWFRSNYFPVLDRQSITEKTNKQQTRHFENI